MATLKKIINLLEKFFDTIDLQYLYNKYKSFYLKNGQILTSEEFLRLAIQQIDEFSSVQNLINNFCLKVEMSNNEYNYSKKEQLKEPVTSLMKKKKVKILD